MARVDLDRRGGEFLCEEQPVLAAGSHHGGDGARCQQKRRLTTRARRPADPRQLLDVLVRTDLVELLERNSGSSDPGLAERLAADDVAQQTERLRDPDCADLDLIEVAEEEEEVGFRAKLRRFLSRPRLVGLALHEGVEWPLSHELRCIGVELARDCGNYQITSLPDLKSGHYGLGHVTLPLRASLT